MFLSNAISAILRAPCIRPQNMRRKPALAMAEGANESQVVSLMADFDALDVWLSARGLNNNRRRITVDARRDILSLYSSTACRLANSGLRSRKVVKAAT